LYEIAGAVFWKDHATAIQVIENEAEKQPRNPDVHLIYAFLAGNVGDWIRAYGEATEAVKLVPEWPYAHGLRSTICCHARLPECAVRDPGSITERGAPAFSSASVEVYVADRLGRRSLQRKETSVRRRSA